MAKTAQELHFSARKENGGTVSDPSLYVERTLCVV
jgi:hypothetical protein